MANHVYAVFIALGYDGQIHIVFDQVAGIHEFAIHFSSQGGLGKACTNIGGNVVNGYGFGKTTVAAIGQSNNGHDDLLMVSQR